MAESRRFGDPRKECDLVMKGGVASGIVYPQAILTLAERYRLRSVGGTSAGAIAAALAVAAEYGRESGGFERLDAIRAGLLRRGAIKELFQPTARTKPLWETIWGFIGMQARDLKSTRLNSSHANISYAVFCLKKKTRTPAPYPEARYEFGPAPRHPLPPRDPGHRARDRAPLRRAPRRNASAYPHH